jgi:predicted MFS family arabinose efflux permease
MPSTHRFDDRLATTLLVCLVYPIGPAATILMPMIVGGLIDNYQYSEQQAGNIAALEGMGLVVASVLAALWVRRLSWIRASAVAFLAYAALNAVSAAIADYQLLLALRALTGFAGGCLFAITVAALGDNRAPDRAFGLAQAVQSVMMLAGFQAAPFLLQSWGVGSLYGTLAAACLILMVTLRWFPAQGRAELHAVQSGTPGTGHAGLIWLGLFASVLFFINVFGFWAFVERMGQAAGLGAETVGLALGVSQVAAIGGALVAAWASDRYGRYLPLVVVGIGQVMAVFMLSGTFGTSAYFASTGVFQALFIVGVSYQMGAIAQLDTRGRFLVMMTGAQGLGAAIGPAAAAALIGSGNDYGGVIQLAALLCIVSTMLFLFIVWRGRNVDATLTAQ